MSRYSDQTEETASGDRRINGILMCMAQDCPLRASVNMGGGWLCGYHAFADSSRWLCGYHAFADSSRWSDITRKLYWIEVKEARHALASLRLAIADRRVDDTPAMMSRAQRLIMKAGASVEDVRLRPQVDHLGHEFPETPEHFASRMQSVLIRLVAPEVSTTPQKRTAVNDPVSLDDLASEVEEEMA